MAEGQRLARRWRDSQDPAAADELLGSHLRLVVKIARGFSGYGAPLADLVAEGNVGLVRALAEFDPERGFRFATYAMWWIRAALQEYVLRDRSLVTLGANPAKKKLFFKLRRLNRRPLIRTRNKTLIKKVSYAPSPSRRITYLARMTLGPKISINLSEMDNEHR